MSLKQLIDVIFAGGSFALLLVTALAARILFRPDKGAEDA